MLSPSGRYPGHRGCIVDLPVIQVHEAELVHELASKRIEAEEAEKAKIAEKLSAAEVSCSYHNLLSSF